MKTCPKCGKRNSNNSVYCEQCGYALSGLHESSNKHSSVLTIILSVVSAALIIGGVGLLLSHVIHKENDDASTDSSAMTEDYPQDEAEEEAAHETEEAAHETEEAAHETEKDLVADSNSTDSSETSENAVLTDEDNIYYHNGHTYAVYDQSISWTSASAACEYARGHLATVQDEEEEEFIKSIVGNKAFYWLGGYKDDNDNWRWVTDESWEYTDWSPGQPDNYSAIDEAPQGFLVYSTAFDSWDDQQESGASRGPTSVAEGAAGYICEWDEIK